MKPLQLPEANDKLNFSGLDPLDSRYYDQLVAGYLSEQSRIAYQAYVEAALAQTLADYKICSRKVANEIEVSTRRIKAQDVYKEEQVTKHDIKALVNCIKKGISNEAKPFVHFGATSFDIVATANALQLRDAAQKVVIPRLKILLKTLIKLSEQHSDTVQVGRTHGQHAVPITFGYALSEYVSRLGETWLALEDLSQMLVGKFSGAVGAYNALNIFVDDPIRFEKDLLAKVGLKPAPYATQIAPPDSTVRLLDELGIAAGIMANLANDMRHLQRTEINEVHEKFEKGQTGSSTMAHKKNPINFENVVSLAKQVTAQLTNANLNLSSEHQRDLTDSASSRFYPLVLASVASMATRLEKSMSKLEVNREAMQHNLALSAGAIAAEPLYLLFEKFGHIQAHEKAKALAHKALQTNQSLVDVIKADKEAGEYWQKFSPSMQRIITEPEKYYIGLSSKKTNTIATLWKRRLALAR